MIAFQLVIIFQHCFIYNSARLRASIHTPPSVKADGPVNPSAAQICLGRILFPQLRTPGKSDISQISQRSKFNQYCHLGRCVVRVCGNTCACMLTIDFSTDPVSKITLWKRGRAEKSLHVVHTRTNTHIRGVSVLVSEGRQFVHILSVYREERDGINNVASWLRESTKSN